MYHSMFKENHESTIDVQVEQSAHRIPALKPHDTLPVELLSEIFLCCLEGDYVRPLKGDDMFERQRQLPWALGRVCSRWRQIALNEPRLWNRVQIPHSSLSVQTLEGNRHVKMTQSLFARSGRLLLSYSTSPAETFRLDPAKEAGNPLPDLIVRYADRFREMTVQSPLLWLRPILELQSGAFKNLEVLTLNFREPHFTTIHTTISLHDAFSASSQLRYLCLESKQGYTLLDLSSTCLPCGHLQYVILDDVLITPAEGLHFLSSCTSIVECTLDFHQYATPLLIDHLVVLPHLRTLSLRIRNQNFGMILASLTLPLLQILVLEARGIIPWQVQDDLLRMLRRSSCQLALFHTTLRVQANHVTALLEAMVTITTFSLPSFILPDATLVAMIRGELVPSLEVIYCSVNSVNLFLDFLEARWVQSNDDAEIYLGIRVATAYFQNKPVDPTTWARYQTLQSTFLHQGRDIVLIAR